MTVRFLLVCEGSSDTSIIAHIEELLIHYGLSDLEGGHWAKSGPLMDKIQDGLRHFGDCNLLFVHRDADANQETSSAGPERRRDEIAEAVRDSGYTGPYVSIVPVRMTESWLLLNESEIRRVAGRPRGDIPLDLPAPNQVEEESDPKGCLELALITASETSGRRLRKFRRDIPYLRRLLLAELPTGGLLEQVPSWSRFRDDLLLALTVMGNQ